jgi:hypothetical protein
MTIDSSWILSFKEEAAEAFSDKSPFRPKAVFCDGQIRLMRGHQDEFITWDEYIFHQFHNHVRKFYDKAETVILAFDDYANVPQAKCMTQLKRRRHLPQLEILAREPLPPFPPSGERWSQHIANRTFKSKVIALVIQELPRLLRLRAGQTLVIDYAGCPVEYSVGEDGETVTRELEDLVPMGEADVKFTRYAEIYRDLMVDSVDGDSIPIALVYYEACIRELTGGTMRAADLQGGPPRISIYRMTTRLAEEKKRRKEEADTRRTFEFVDVGVLYHMLTDIFSQCMGRLFSPTHSQHLMKMLVVLIGLTGTDFTRSLPQVSGRSVYTFMPDLFMALVRCFDPMSGQIDVRAGADFLVSAIYTCKYESHVRGAAGGLDSILSCLQASKLSQRTRDSLPTSAVVLCTLRNINWLLKYWAEPTLTPDPLLVECGEAVYGFVRRRGKVAYSAE